MKGASAFVWVGIIGAMAFGLYQVKHAVQAREDELARLNRDLIASEEAIRVLRAEWSYLNRPERLARLAGDHLALAPMAAQQIGGFERLSEPQSNRQLDPSGQLAAIGPIIAPVIVKPASAP